jgi:uncharacterized protein (DUF58 family)
MRPTSRAALLFGVAFPLSLLPVLVSVQLWTVWLAAVVGATFLLGLDAVLAMPARKLTARAQAPAVLYIGDAEPELLTLEVGTTWRFGTRAEVLVDLDEDLEAQPAQSVVVPRRGLGPARLPLPLSPRRRGELAVRALYARWTGPLGLMRRSVRVPLDLRVKCVPNVRAVRAAAIRYFASREFLAGLKLERYVGDGSEFESLRDYVPGMDHRAIDWKASARHIKLLVQEFRAERNHQVILAVDTGHLMREPLGADGAPAVPKLDHAVNAALLLAYFGLRTGDRVGLYGFDARPKSFTEPMAGVGAFARLQVATAELDYSTSETNFTLGLMELSHKLRRRSLVVLLTDFVDTISAELMFENLHRLAKRHLVVFVTLRDPALGLLAAARPASSLDLHRAVIAQDLVREREVVLRRLRRLGITTIDAAPGEVSMQLLNRYLEIRRREMI